MLKPLVAFSALLLLGPVLQQLAAKPAPTDAAKTANPFKPTTESIAQAKKMYGYECALCHGATGDGKGDVPAKVKDLTNAADLSDMTDAQLFELIKNGKGDMPGEGVRMKDDQVWSMVAVVRSFSKK